MVFSDDFKKKCNMFFAFGVLILAMVFLFGRFDIYYDLNDDVMIKDILAGIYMGTPETRNMQMLYPLSFLLAVLYHVIPIIPWYGVLLLGSQLVCLYLIAKRCMAFCAKTYGKIMMAVTILLVWAGLFLYRFVFLQYTVTAGILVATALFRFMTNYSADPEEVSFTQDTARVTQDNMPLGLFVRKNIPNMMMLVLAFCLRSELALLMLPFTGVAFVVKWAEERPVFTKNNVEKFLSVLLIVVFSCGLCFAVDSIAYSKTPWHHFRVFFDARTEIYDFTGIPDYAENQEFYDSIGVSKAEYELLVNYDFAFSEHLDHQVLEQIADYADTLQVQKKSPPERMKEAVWEYFHRYGEEQNQPYVWVSLVLIVMIIASALLQGHFSIFWKMILFAVMRFVSWIYLYYRGRVLDRVTMPLLLVEMMLLLSMLFMEFGIVVEQQKGYSTQLRRMRVLSKWEERKELAVRICPVVSLTILAVVSLIIFVQGTRRTMEEFENREKASGYFETLEAYFRQDSQAFYWIDVYSGTSVSLADSFCI